MPAAMGAGHRRVGTFGLSSSRTAGYGLVAESDLDGHPARQLTDKLSRGTSNMHVVRQPPRRPAKRVGR